MADDPTPAYQTVVAEIRANGPISFARFMEIALYGEHGYYTSHVNDGTDYATSPRMHPSFGALIARYIFKAWKTLGEPDVFDVVELGAGDGGLARDVLTAVTSVVVDTSPDTISPSGLKDTIERFECALQYRAFDASPRGSDTDMPTVQSVDELADLDPKVGCVISNELLDAFPVHVFTIRNRNVLECYVDVTGNGDLTFVEDEVSDQAITDRVGAFASILPDGYRGEVNLGIGEWADTVFKLLKRGYVLIIDYGHERDLLYHPARTEGSLRCYHQHTLSQNPFRHIGQQDITAHVDFTTVKHAMTEAGFSEMMPLKTQRDFLFDLGIDQYIRQTRRDLIKAIDDTSTYSLTTQLRRLNALIDIRGLGDFKVAQFNLNAPTIDCVDLEESPLFSLSTSQSHHLA